MSLPEPGLSDLKITDGSSWPTYPPPTVPNGSAQSALSLWHRDRCSLDGSPGVAALAGTARTPKSSIAMTAKTADRIRLMTHLVSPRWRSADTAQRERAPC